LAAAVAAAWASGIVVIFSAGNGHYGFPAQHPDCIAAGGVFMASNESLRASDYASGFMSNIYPGRRVPDACGLVGMKPKAIYIMLPVEPGDAIDATPWNAPPPNQGLQGGTYPQGDQTANNDGWGCFSGTSAAAPQLAGLAALIKQACPKLTPSDVRDIMRKTARGVTTGNCSTSTGGHPATPGPDVATGDGLVDAHKAVLLAKVRCLTVPGVHRGTVRGPVPPIPRVVDPGPPQPGPIRPQPGPIRPEPGPVLPQPRPEPSPIQPVQPGGPLGASIESASLEALAAAEPQPVPLTSGDIEALERMVINSELKIG
jgi:subtilisin family serine protease